MFSDHLYELALARVERTFVEADSALSIVECSPV